jgi:hypothetical protein
MMSFGIGRYILFPYGSSCGGKSSVCNGERRWTSSSLEFSIWLSVLVGSSSVISGRRKPKAKIYNYYLSNTFDILGAVLSFESCSQSPSFQRKGVAYA